jgi:hypothetical protein
MANGQNRTFMFSIYPFATLMSEQRWLVLWQGWCSWQSNLQNGWISVEGNM